MKKNYKSASDRIVQDDSSQSQYILCSTRACKSSTKTDDGFDCESEKKETSMDDAAFFPSVFFCFFLFDNYSTFIFSSHHFPYNHKLNAKYCIFSVVCSLYS